jgi:3-oxoacyl-[acyl-carrier protein] reductase
LIFRIQSISFALFKSFVFLQRIFCNPPSNRNHRSIATTTTTATTKTPTMKIALAFVTTLATLCPGKGFVHKTAFASRAPWLRMADAAAPSDAKVCLVTGASQGIGKSIALELGRNGQKVVINHIQGCEEDAATTVEEVKALGGDAIAVPADCTHPDEVKKMFDEVIAHYGTCDVLVNNAGITKDALVMRMKPSQWQAVIGKRPETPPLADMQFLLFFRLIHIS